MARLENIRCRKARLASRAKGRSGGGRILGNSASQQSTKAAGVKGVRAGCWQGLSGRRASSLGLHVMRNTISSHSFLLSSSCGPGVLIVRTWTQPPLPLLPLYTPSFPCLNPLPPPCTHHPLFSCPSLRLSSLLVERSVVSWVEGFSSHRRPNTLPPSRRRKCRV